jgi:putative protease
VKIEGRQRSAAYVAQVTRVWRDAIDAAVRERKGFTVRDAWMHGLDRLSEGRMHTLGAYYRPWK